jgi:D-alanyl-D-alanine carboxypeptidase
MSTPDIPVSTDYAIFDGLSRDTGFSPGTKFKYSNVNYLLLAKIIDKASGMPYENYIRKIIIEPFRLNNTIMPTYTSTFQDINYIPESHMSCLVDSDIKGHFIDFTIMYIDWDRGAGDIISTVNDLNVFHKALREGKIISKEKFEEMRHFLPAFETISYGLGYFKEPFPSVNADLEGHEGGYPGSTTWVLYWIGKDTYISLNANDNGAEIDKYIIDPILEYLKPLITKTL